MPADQELISFIRSTFASVWSLELALLLRKEPDTVWSHDRMVTALRASNLVVMQSVTTLHAAGVLMIEEHGARYAPISEDLDHLIGKTESLYLVRPDRVRRIIISQRTGSLASFADAFKLGEP